MQPNKLFAGLYTAIITPFTRLGEIDEVRFEKQIERQIAGGVDGIVPCGTTGESPTLSPEEHTHVVELAVKFARRRVKVLAGTGANSTREAIHLTKAAEDAGADGSLQVAPYYNKPSQEGIFQHFKAVAEATRLRVVLYNIPSRCGVDVTLQTAIRLYKEGYITGIKVANGSCDYVTELRREVGKGMAILSGDDSLTLPFMALGADGVISVVSNLAPTLLGAMVGLAAEGNFASAREINASFFPLTKALFLDGNPAGVKLAMKHIELDSGVLRLPLVSVSKDTADIIAKRLHAFGLSSLR